MTSETAQTEGEADEQKDGKKKIQKQERVPETLVYAIVPVEQACMTDGQQECKEREREPLTPGY